MKVKDYIGWLQNLNGTATGCTWHFFPGKVKSACGRVKHPTRQFNAAFVRGSECKVCRRKHGSRTGL
jgi:hypothetical protein